MGTSFSFRIWGPEHRLLLQKLKHSQDFLPNLENQNLKIIIFLKPLNQNLPYNLSITTFHSVSSGSKFQKYKPWALIYPRASVAIAYVHNPLLRRHQMLTLDKMIQLIEKGQRVTCNKSLFYSFGGAIYLKTMKKSWKKTLEWFRTWGNAILHYGTSGS